MKKTWSSESSGGDSILERSPGDENLTNNIHNNFASGFEHGDLRWELIGVKNGLWQ